MRARIVRCPDYSDAWLVQTKQWWWPVWIDRKYFIDDAAHTDAFLCAERYLNPRVTEVTK